MSIIDIVSSELKINRDRLKKYISTCPYRYKIFKIQKRNNDGFRTIAQPARELKFIQKFISAKFLKQLPVHDSCKSYRKDTNIWHNAISHVDSKYLLKMDFKDFFPSITPYDLVNHIEKYDKTVLCEEDTFVYRRVFFYFPEKGGELCLSIGAPSSPFISNTIMYDFDKKINNLCMSENVIYSRYADDISFSTNRKNVLFDLKKSISLILNEIKYPNIKINNKKTVILSRKDNIHITGLVLSNDGKVSIGREKKRFLKSMIFKYINNDLSEQQVSYLVGYLSFVKSVEPDFVNSLEEKYGDDVIKQLK